MSDPFATVTVIPLGTPSVVIGQHRCARDARHDMFHAIVDGVVVCNGDKEPNPPVYMRISKDIYRPEQMRNECPTCRDAVAVWAKTGVAQ